MSNSENKKITILGWAIIIAIPLVILISACELTLRILFPDINILTKVIRSTADSRGYVLKENSKITYQGLYEKHKPIIWKINPQGLRSDRVENTISNKFRVLTYGDSETYGWSVDIKDSWQRQMESLDTNIEVLNFGIPGYNVENIADHLQHTIGDFHPDMLIYFFNKNDFYPAFNYNPLLSRSYAYLAFRMGIYQLSKEKRKAWRKSPEGAKFIQTHISRMLELSKQYKAPLYILVMHWDYVEPIQQLTEKDNETIKIINIEKIVDKFKAIDAHLTKPAHSALAKYLCRQISADNTQKCTPHSFEQSFNYH